MRKKTQTLYSQCRVCEYTAQVEWIRNNPKTVSAKNKRAYRKLNPDVIRRTDRTEEEKRQRAVDKSSRRYSRAKQARPKWDKEFTSFVMDEARDLCRKREQITGEKWHVDHVIPLNGEFVSGLHVWNNFQVIPAKQNLLKGNKHA